MNMVIHALAFLAITVGGFGLKRIVPSLAIIFNPTVEEEIKRGTSVKIVPAEYLWHAFLNSILAIFYAMIFAWGLSCLNIQIFR